MIFQATGCVCKVTLGSGFTTLNGIYYISLEMAYRDAIASGIDFVANLYTPAGKTATDFAADQQKYVNDTVYVCNPIADRSQSFYIPESLFAGPPDPTVKTYYRRIAAIDLGICEDANTLQPMMQQIGQIATAQTGILNSIEMIACTSNPTYMTDDEYTAYQATLTANKSAITNPVTQVMALTAENTELRNRLAVTEQVLAQYLTQKEST